MSEHEVSKTSADEYWKANVRIILICLVIWAVCSLGFAIILRPALMGYYLYGGGSWILVWSARFNFNLCRPNLFLYLVHEPFR